MDPIKMDWDAETNNYLKAKAYRWLQHRIISEAEPEQSAPPVLRSLHF